MATALKMLRTYGKAAGAVAMQLALDARAAYRPKAETKWLRVFDGIQELSNRAADVADLTAQPDVRQQAEHDQILRQSQNDGGSAISLH